MALKEQIPISQSVMKSPQPCIDIHTGRLLPHAYTALLLMVLLMSSSCRQDGEAPKADGKQSSDPETSRSTPTPPPSRPDYWEKALDFTANLPLSPNLEGNLEGEIAFIQNTLVGPDRNNRKRPLLVTDRAAYLLFFPKNAQPDSIDATIQDSNGSTLDLTLHSPEHGAHGDFNNKDGRPPVVFSKRAWSAVIPWDYMHSGIRITLRDETGMEGSLSPASFEFGAPLELVSQHIELGMLLDPSTVPVNKWSRPGEDISAELALNYFQMVPVSKFVAARYLPIHLPKVVLPNGNVYTNRSSYTEAGIYKGDMRENLAKGLISTGINLANVGITSSHGGDQKQPRPYRQTTAHTSAGMYTSTDKEGRTIAKMVVHGLSGGGGQLTLRNTTGNEFSHEYGHDHGLGHYPGGPELSRHRADGAWGFHQFKHRFIGNLNWNGPTNTGRFPYEFGKDAMAGGAPMGPISEFTLHTPYSLMEIQQKISDQSGSLSQESPTGYVKWDAEKQSMVTAEVETPKPDKTGINVVTLVGFYDPKERHDLPSFIYPALYGNWGNIFTPSTIERHDPELATSRCWLEVSDKGGNKLRFPLRDQRIKPNLMNQFHVNLPAPFQYTKASILFMNEDDSSVALATRELEPPTGELPPPVIVGREFGFTNATHRLRTMSQLFEENSHPSVASLHQAMQDYYGRIISYAPELIIENGQTYLHDGGYFQALEDNPHSAPSEGSSGWRRLGEAEPFLSKVQLVLGEAGVDHAKETMNGKSGVYYYVPVDHSDVVSSESSSTKSGKWYAKGDHSKLTVMAKRDDGSRVAIILRGQINDRHALNRGAPVNESSRVRFRFHKEDNKALPSGSYGIEFACYAQGWHSKKLVECFKVHGKVTSP